MLRLIAGGLLLGILGGSAAGQDAEPGAALTAQMAEMLGRAAGGHSPTPEEIRAVESMPGLTDVKQARELEPLLEKALASTDSAMRGYGLAMLVGMQTLPEPAPAGADAAGSTGTVPAITTSAPAPPANGVKKGSLPLQVVPAAYKGDVGKALVPLVAAIGHQLTDDAEENRMMAADALGGFTPNPPAAVTAALLDFLKRDDAVGAVGLEVVESLLHVGPLSDDAASAVAKYLRRSDQTHDEQANLVDAIASGANRNKLVDKALLSFLNSDDPGLESRVILSLPALDLTAQSFAEVKARVEGIAAGEQDSLQVVNAAKAVAGCWTQVKMASGCPVY